MRAMIDRLPASGGPALEALRGLLRDQAAFEMRMLVRTSGSGTRG
jgi:hypothetical protein